MKKEIRLEIKARNNLVLSRMEELGIKSIAELCRRAGPGVTSENSVGDLVRMRISPLKYSSTSTVPEWTNTALTIAAVLLCDPEDLFSENLRKIKIEAGKHLQLELDVNEIPRLGGQTPRRLLVENTGERDLQVKDLGNLIQLSLNTLTPNQAKVITLRFGLEDGEERTLEQVGEILNFTKERIRQIEGKALRKMRMPRRSRPLKQYLSI